MATITLDNVDPVNIVPSQVGAALVVSVNGVQVGTIIDEFDPNPGVMKVFVQDLSSSAPVSAQWRSSSGGPWVPFTPARGGATAEFTVPAAGAPDASFDLAISAGGMQASPNPRLILRTKIK
ncbi:MAG: hypothetical protein IPK74_21480 [Deltaproteobacteria bacterium]|nr:hypothetical protein [Deltaproteobacteria bacterium]